MPNSEEDKKSAYDKILHETLLERTGRSFRKNLEQAPLPKTPQRLSKEEAVNLIFDNILKKKEMRAAGEIPSSPPPVPPPQAPKEIEMSRTYSDILDSILWPEDQNEGPAEQLRQTVAEHSTVQQPEAAAPAYQDILNKTLRSRTSPPTSDGKRRQASPLISQTFAAALDSILELDETAVTPGKPIPTPQNSQDSDLLTQTLYNQKLDEILWPSEAKKKSGRVRYPSSQ